ncbi:MAG: hypothetical protein HYS23_00490 [Geobacter sp.]|nr:hypothetical protein [Geobacter sp.]
MNIPLRKNSHAASNRYSSAQVVGRPWIGSFVLAVLLGLFVMGSVEAAHAVDIPALPVIHPAIAAANPALVKKRGILVTERDALRTKSKQQYDSCSAVEEGTPAEKDCTERLAQLTTEVALHVKDTNDLATAISAAVAIERKRLEAQEKSLTQAIAKDVTAVRGLGFDRRAEDFEEWEKLATDAKREFEHKVKAEATSLFASNVEDRLLTGFKNLNKAKVEGWIAVLMKQDPPPTEIIAVLRGMASVIEKDGVRQKLADDAKHLAKLIKNVAKSSKVSGWTDGLPVLLDIVCDGVPDPTLAKQCKAFKATANVTVASLYNNAARRVALNEVERLTTMTENQLRALAKINELMVKHVKERNEVRARLRELA